MGLPIKNIDSQNQKIILDSTVFKGKNNPGIINNLELILPDLSQFYCTENENEIYNSPLKENLDEKIDIKIINEKQWNFLNHKYGTNKVIKRFKFKPEFYSYYKVELNLFKLNLIILPLKENLSKAPISKSKIFLVSKLWTIAEIRRKIMEILQSEKYNFKFSQIRLWKLDPGLTYEKFSELIKLNERALIGKYRTLDNDDFEENSGIDFPGINLDLFYNKSIEKCDIGLLDFIVIEQKNAEFIFRFQKNVKVGKCEFCCQEKPLIYQCQCNEVFYCSELCRKKDERFHWEKCPMVEPLDIREMSVENKNSNFGVTGLQNLGNTCYMNAGLQCLSNIYELTKYFLDSKYKREINYKNKLGLQGKLAISYSQFLKLMWYDNSQFISPWDIKNLIGRYNHTFIGHAQQDSHEFISTFLDCLHEDLNKITEKPYIEQKTINSYENDFEFLSESWKNHLSRNQSIIVDLMHGLFKSTLKCSNCGNFSCSFDPYSSISLPIIRENKIRIIFYYVPHDISKPFIKYSLDIEKDKNIDELREIVSKMLNLPKFSTIFSMISGGTIDKLLNRNQKVKKIYKMQEKQHSYLHVMEIDNKIYEKYKIDISKIKSEENLQNIDDFNNGISDEIIRISINICQFIEKPYFKRLSKEIKSTTRFLYINRNENLQNLYLSIFNLLKPIFTNVSLEKSDYENFCKFFPGISSENWNLKFQKPNNFPYILRFINQNAKLYLKREKCYFCQNFDCENCIIPYQNNIKISDILSKIGSKIHNDFYYKFDSKNTSENNTDLELEIIFNEDYTKTLCDFDKLDKIITDKNFKEISKNDNEEISIYDCLNGFSKWEILDQTNLWHCNKCNKEVQANKKIEIMTTPPILILQLKRFKAKNIGVLGTGIRLNNLINFPLENLDLTNHVRNPFKTPLNYNLFAVVNHIGSIGYGHYTSFAKNEHNNEWYIFDDNKVTKLDPKTQNICTTDSYILFYKRKDLYEADFSYEKIKQEIPTICENIAK